MQHFTFRLSPACLLEILFASDCVTEVRYIIYIFDLIFMQIYKVQFY